MNVDTKAKVHLKFGNFETVYVNIKAQKASEIATLPKHVNLELMHMLSHMWTLHTSSLPYETHDYECRH